MLQAGSIAPAFSLLDIAGNPQTLTAPCLLAFFKVSCPTCHLTLPLLERVKDRLPIIGISQDDAESTVEFLEYFGVTYPVLIDPKAESYAVSNAYGIAVVPSLFLLDAHARITWSLEGFDKTEMAAQFGPDLFRPDDNVPAMKPGCGSKN